MSQRFTRILVQVIVWLLIYLLPYFFVYGQLSRQTVFKTDGDYIHLISTILLVAFAYINYFYLVPQFYLQRKYLLYGGCIITAVILVIWFPGLFQNDISGHQPPPAYPFRNDGPPGKEGGPPGLIGRNYNIALFFICTFLGISIQQQLQYLEVKKERLGAELSFLKAQISPHFLFNTLNSIYSLAIQKSDETPRAITQLSEMMRYILLESDADFVSLEKELIYIENYISLQKTRLGDTVKVTYLLHGDPGTGQIAPLLLMSFIENAFKHGVNPDEESVISIKITLNASQLDLAVVNNKVTNVSRENVIGIGLKNARSRLDRLYPGRHELVVDDNDKSFSVLLTMTIS